MGICASKPAARYAVSDTDCKVVEVNGKVKASPTSAVKNDCPAPESKVEPSKIVCKLPEAVTNPPSELIGNLLDPVNGPACGLPYKVHYLGPPKPPCEAERLATARALGRIDDPHEDPEINNILQLVSSIFKAPASLCALFDDQRVFISEQDGDVIPRGHFPWRWTLCGWSLAFKNPQILVIPDTQEDARFANNIKITQAPHVRFYCGAPLVASNGHRLGTLCFADIKPRKFDAASCVIMNNMSELVVRQLEKGNAIKANAKQQTDLAANYGNLQRAFDAFEHCVVMLEISEEDGWKVIYANAALHKMSGYEREEAVGSQLQDLFEEGDGTALPNGDLQAAVAANKSYRVKLARAKKSSACFSSGPLTLLLRPASKEALDDQVMPIGIPSFLPACSDDPSGRKLYFMTIDVAGQTGSTRRSTNLSSFDPMSSLCSSAEMEGLDMGHLLGKGTFGTVYYGTYFGTPVAVKIIEADASKAGPMMEAMLSQQLKHPLVISTLKFFHKSLGSSSSNVVSLHDSANSRMSNIMTPIGEEGTPSSVVASAAVFSGGSPPGTRTGSGSGPADSGWAVMDYVGGTPDMSTGLTPSPLSDACSLKLSGSQSKQWRQTWLIMEYADRGCLQDALDRGWLCSDRSNVEKGANMSAVLATAHEIASAMQYLHSCNVVHGDLSGWNIMLSTGGPTAPDGGRDFVAKIADFGLARSMEVNAEVMTKNYGTLTHQPPETLTKGIVSKATDIYSFGVLLWQMYTGSRPWCGMSHAQIIMQVGKGAKLKWPASAPKAYRSLAEVCMHMDVSVRPHFDDIVPHLENLQKELAAAGGAPCTSLAGEWE